MGTIDFKMVKQHFGLHCCFGVLLGSAQFFELGLNVPFSIGASDTFILWLTGIVLSVTVNVVLATLCVPAIATRTAEPFIGLGRGLFAVGMIHLGVLIVPFAVEKYLQHQPALAGMLLIVWTLFGVLLYTNGRFWIRRLLANHQSLSRLNLFLLGLTVLCSGAGVLAFHSRGYGASNAITSDPDVLVVSLDGVGVNAVSAYQQDSIASTPNLDSLASQCLDFTEAISVATDVFPSHVGMFTGRYPGQINIVDEKGLLKFASETLAERFAREGYATALFANSPLLDMKQGFAQGMQNVDVDAPLNLFGLNIRGAGHYRLGNWIQVGQGIRHNPVTPIQNAHHFFEGYTDKPVFAWVQSQIPDHIEPAEYKNIVESLDEQLGDFVRMLDNRPVERERLLIVTSSFGNHFEYGKSDGRGISEAVIRVPLIICPLKENAFLAEPQVGQVRTVDIPNTVYAQVGFSHKKEIPSVDISDRTKEHIVYQTVLIGEDPESEGGFQMGYRFEASNSDIMYKYKWYTARKQHGVYNLNLDPTEMENIVGIAGGMSSELATALTQAAKAIPDLHVSKDQVQPEFFQPIQ